MHQVLESSRADLEHANALGDVIDVVRVGARRLLNAQGATFVLREGDRCFYADEDSIAPLWKGQRFPMTQCISGWAMLHRSSAVVPDISVDPRIPQEAYRPTYIKSLAMVPVLVRRPPGGQDARGAIGAIGVYWSKHHTVRERQLADLEELAQLTGQAVARVGLAGAPWAPTFDGTNEPEATRQPRQPGAPPYGASHDGQGGRHVPVTTAGLRRVAAADATERDKARPG